jgi:hypothetical protein
MRREYNDRLAAESRSTPELAMTQQAEVKAMRDGRVNRTDLELQPPVIRLEREIGLPLAIRPRGEIGERRGNSLREWRMAPAPQAVPELEEAGRRDAYRYFARNRTEEPVRAALYDQDLIDDWCGELEECWVKTLQLSQQFEAPEVFARVVGGDPVPWEVSNDELRKQWDLQIMFNSEQFDPERVKAKVETYTKMIAPLDLTGQVDAAPIVRYLVQYYFPEVADEALRDVEHATAKEVRDEQINWALMLAGEEPPMHEHGQNFQLRLQWLERKIEAPETSQRLASAPDAAQLVERRRQHLRHMVEQKTINAQAGRVGVAPAAPAGAA